MSKKERVLTITEVAKSGGDRIMELHGKEYMSEIGSKGNAAMRKLGKEFYVERARKAAESRKRNKKLAEGSSMDKLAKVLIGQ